MPLSREMIDASDPKVAQIGHPAPPWLINYADLMTELCCFFIILFSMSKIVSQNQIESAAKQVNDAIKNEKGAEGVQTKITDKGLVITVPEKLPEGAFFDSGRADLKPEAKKILQIIFRVMNTLPNDVAIEGHTDNVRIHNEYYDSNWELSTARATSVARLLIDKYGLPPERVGAIGYGQYRETVPNDTSEHRAKNRRVVFFVKNAPLRDITAAPPAAGKEKVEAAPVAPVAAEPAPAPAAPAGETP